MILFNHCGVTYLVATGVRSRAAEYTYFGNDTNNKQIMNGPISIIAKILEGVMSSVAEAEIGALYMNTIQLLSLRVPCEELEHPQPATTSHTNAD